MDVNIDEYRAFVKGFIEDDSPIIFSNYSMHHARCITDEFIKTARKSITLFTGAVLDGFYNQKFRERLVKKLKENPELQVKILIISKHDRNLRESSERLDLFKEDLRKEGLQDRFDYRMLRMESPAINVNHFLVVDNKSYRLEEPHEDLESVVPDVVHADVCYNGEKRAGQLTGLFNNLWEI